MAVKKKLSFKVLKSNYTTIMHPDGDFASCAIRMSMTLAKQNAYTSRSFRGYKSKNGWAMRAEELYQYLRRYGRLGNAELLTSPPLENGIVYLRNCWSRQGQTEGRRTGDHIDLYFYDPKKNEYSIRSGELWPTEVHHDIVENCRDGKIRFWKCDP